MSGNAFDRTDLRIRNVAAGESGEVAGTQDEALIPHFPEFLQYIRSKLEAAEEALGREYQREIVYTGALELVSPLTGQPARAAESILVLGRTFYRFCETEEFYVAAARIKFGYPLLALFVPRANLLVRWEVENDKRGIEPKHIAALGAVLAERKCFATAADGAQPVTIVMGHKNFAHHLWNELPAMERLLRDLARDRIPQLLVTREPLGPIDKLFPEIADWKIERLRGRAPAAVNAKARLFVNLGSYCVTSSIRRRVLSHARNSAGPNARKLGEEIGALNAPVFWLSVRTQTPTVTNQREALTELGRRILEEFPGCMILFDGFSPPDDWGQSESADIEFYRTAAHKSINEIDATIADIAGRRAPSESQRLVNMGGWGILDSIAIASLATCYFCHVGTVQHKIGWTTDVPGIIHANRRIISRKSPVWYAPARLEGGAMPKAIPAKMVTGAGKEVDYEILDVVGVAEAVCKFFRLCASESRTHVHHPSASPSPL